MVFADGSAELRPQRIAGRSALAYLRDADYASGAAIAIPRDLFRRLGGLTCATRRPTEDTDLAFAVREANLRVLVQPAAKVMHDEGGTARHRHAQRAKAAQVRNQGVFRVNTARLLVAQLLPGTLPARGAARAPAPGAGDRRATPQPDHDSGRCAWST